MDDIVVERFEQASSWVGGCFCYTVPTVDEYHRDKFTAFEERPQQEGEINSGIPTIWL
jgi:hypothetical protein